MVGSTFSGADVQQLRALAGKLEAQAGKLREIAASSSAAITTAQWTGANIERVRSEWNRSSKPAISGLASELAGIARDLRAQAAQQEEASAATASSSSNGGSTSRTTSVHSEAETESYERLFEAIKLGALTTGTLEDFADIVAALKSGALDYKSFSDWLGKVKGVDAATFLSLAGMGISAHELGTAIGSDDPAATLEASLDLVMGAVGIKVPGAGLAWEFGKMMGETGYNSLQAVYDSPGAALDFAARDMYGKDSTFEGLEQWQRDALMTRYEGMGGLLVSFVDSAGGAWDDFTRWASGGGGRGPR